MKVNNIIVENLPEKEVVEKFCKGFGKTKQVLMTKQNGCNKLKKTYCRNVTMTNYNIDQKVLDKVMKKIQINKAPGNDLING